MGSQSGQRGSLRAWLVAGALGLAPIFLAPRVLGGSIEEQRARLPPAAECADPVEGIWLGLNHEPNRGKWSEFMLTVHRVRPDSNALQGEIQGHLWNGEEGDNVPPPCGSRPRGWEEIAHMPANGEITGEKIAFGAQTVGSIQRICGRTGSTYAPDTFSGTIDPAIQEFQSVDNDGRYAFDLPVVFRRIKCFDTRRLPAPDIAPPPFAPERRWGCGR